MKNSIGAVLSKLRKDKKLMQKDVAANLSDLGFKVGAKTIYNWEKGLANPGIPHFLALCDMLDVDDVLWQFAGVSRGPYAGLNADGRQKAREFIDLLLQVDMYKEGFERRHSPVKPADIDAGDSPRVLRLYDIPVSAGTGNFLDDSSYEEIEVPSYVPAAVDFALRISGDSMEPLLRNEQVIWVKEQEVLDSGDIGVFIYSGDVYCKKLIADGTNAYLRSLNPIYADVKIKEDFGFKVVGKVVS